MSTAASRSCSLKSASGPASARISRSALSNRSTRSPKRCGAALDRENTLATTSSALRTTRERTLSRAPRRAQEPPDQRGDLPPWRSGVAPRSVGLDALVRRRVHVHDGAPRSDHAAQRAGHSFPIHPVEGLGEGDRCGTGRGRGQLLGPAVHPVHVGDAEDFGLPCSLRQHVPVGVQPRGSLEPRGQQQGERAGPAADVEQPTAAVEGQLGDHGVDQLRGIGHPPLHVVGRAARVQRRVPLPPGTGHLRSVGDRGNARVPAGQAGSAMSTTAAPAAARPTAWVRTSRSRSTSWASSTVLAG